MNQPGKVANPARCQLNRENDFYVLLLVLLNQHTLQSPRLFGTATSCHTLAGRDGLPPLLRAAEKGITVAIRVLLGAPSINVNARAPRNKKTALVLAARAGHLEAVQMLLGAGADTSLADRRDWSAMHFAAWKGHLRETR